MGKVPHIEILIAMNGILSMHERAQKAGVACQLNGVTRHFSMDRWNLDDEEAVDEGLTCGSVACLGGSSELHPWFKVNGPADMQDFSPLGSWGKYALEMRMLFYGSKPEGGDAYNKELRDITIPEVRAVLHGLILKHGGERALARANRLKKRGDKLRLGIPK